VGRDKKDLFCTVGSNIYLTGQVFVFREGFKKSGWTGTIRRLRSMILMEGEKGKPDLWPSFMERRRGGSMPLLLQGTEA